MLASVYETDVEKRPKGGLNEFRCVDRQWWVDFKRHFYGWDKQFPNPFVCPYPNVGPPAPTLHDGTFNEAGVSPDRVEALDSICSKTVDDYGESVEVCLARHGVVFLYKAYGNQPSGRRLEVETPCDISSSAKPIGSSIMMMLVNKGLVHCDDHVDVYLPPFRNIRVKKPLTVRELYNHMNGLVGTWGDAIPDTEETVAGYYSQLDVGNYSYNGVGFALGGKIIEAISGEALPQFILRHLANPLGMEHTQMARSGGGALSTARDLATVGQMLLNRGAYGNMRFFEEKTFVQMLPPRTASATRGMGLIWMPWKQYGFGGDTFGHNSANSTVLGIDPGHDLVVAIVSGGGEKRFITNSKAFFTAIISALN